MSERFWSKVDRRGPDECWEWQASRHGRGYGKFSLKRSRWVGAHRVAWELENGPIPRGMFVCHKCDNPPCCNPSHLFLGTALDNARDAVMKQRHYHGERHHTAKLSVAQVTAILISGEPAGELAARYGVSRSLISMIKSGTNWKIEFEKRRGDVVPVVRKLSEADVELMRFTWATLGHSLTKRSLAKAFGVSGSLVGMVLKRKVWVQL